MARLRALPGRTPLRVTLVAAVVALVALALAVTGLAATAALRGYLVDQVDDDLRTTSPATALRDVPFDGAPGGPPQRRDEVHVRISAADGSARYTYTRGELDPPLLAAADVTGAGPDPFTVPADGDGPAWRVLVLGVPGGAQTVAVGYPLDEVTSTVRQLGTILVVVGTVVLLLLAGLAYAAVRASLRPLTEVERTAAAIADGDLSRRVPERDPRTEVGRLSRAFNAMLAQIQAAFRDREAAATAARSSEERMRRFVADASHELRTPLTSIRGFAELHRQGGSTDRDAVARATRRIEEEAARMGLLVDDLLLLARLDQQRPLQHRPVDLLAVANDAVHDARAVDPSRAVELVVRGDEPPVVAGDEHRLRQVVGNLVSNALTHTPAGSDVTVTVGTAVEPDPVAVLEVSDRGPGLAPQDAARVFERFYRAETSRTRAAGGSGLGLAIVAALVQAHRGTVSVEPRDGGGTTFRAVLPLAMAPGREATV